MKRILVTSTLIALLATATHSQVFAQTADGAVSTATVQARAPKLETILLTDAKGRARTFRDASGYEYQCTYDQRGWLVAVERHDEKGAVLRTMFGYDANGQLVIARLATGYTLFFGQEDGGERFARDQFGRKTGLTTAAGVSRETREPGAERLATAAQSTVVLVEALRSGK